MQMLLQNINPIKPDNPLWKDGIVSILNSGKTLDAIPRKPARLGYLLSHELATSATQNCCNPDPSTVLLHLEVASSAKAMSILIQRNGGVVMSNPAHEINKYIQDIMKTGKFDTAEELFNQSLGQLLKSYDNFSRNTLTAPIAPRSRPSHNRQKLFNDLANSALAPVKPEQFEWSILDSEDDE
eukprot:scaffold34438_cov23-Tisochrysis_lutea.AAC.1